MLTRHFVDFLHDERGSYTIWSLVWFIMYVLVGGLAVDGTDAYRIKTELQSTADSAALAGLLSLGQAGQDPVQVAVDYAEANMPPGLNGTVLKPSEVYVGTWNGAERHFTEGGSTPNAVYVVARRDAENLNAVEMSFLRIAQIWGLGTWWNINAVSVAAKGIDKCNNNGIIAGGKLDIKTWTKYQNNICLIGNDGIWHRDNKNEFETGVYAGVGCTSTDKKCIGPSEGLAFGNEEFSYAFNVEGGGNYMDTTRPLNAEYLDEYIDAVTKMGTEDKYDTYPEWQAEMESEYSYIAWQYPYDLNGNGELESGEVVNAYEYLANPLSQALTSVGDLTTLPSDAFDPLGTDPATRGYTVYNIDCSSSGLDLPSGIYLNMAIMANCPINLHNDYVMNNVIISTTYKGQTGIHANGNLGLGPRPEESDCHTVGGVELWAYGSSVKFAAGGEVNNVRILSSEDVHFAAQADGALGVHIEALGDVFTASGSAQLSTFGLCPNAPPNGAQGLTYALVY